jgi:hypothetical protein
LPGAARGYDSRNAHVLRTLGGNGIVDAPRKTYRLWDPDAYRQQARSPHDQLPEGDLVFFFLDLIGQLDLTALYAPYEDQRRGARPSTPG